MTTKRRKLLAFPVLAAIGGVIAYSLLSQDDEPKYQERRLSDWLEQYVEKERVRTSPGEAQAAVRNIGTNALPHLLKWINYEHPAWRITLGRRLPRFITKSGVVYRWVEGGAAGRRAVLATIGFEILGTNAVSAIPELEALMRDNAKPQTSSRAITSLSNIGESAIPVLRAGLADSNQANRWRIVYGFRNIGFVYGTNDVIPLLLEALNDHDLSVRFAATNFLKGFAPEALTNTAPK